MISEASSNPMAFKISRVEDVGTPGVSRKTASSSGGAKQGPLHDVGKYQWLLETLLIAVCFFLYAGQPAPDVNESHYLTKAKHFWNPEYCPGDLFLGSGFSHWLFYFSFGWLTKFISLSAFAWTGRIITWSFMAFAWQRLSFTIVPLKFMSVLSALFFLLLNDRFHLAGEWVVGGFEAKGFAYAFVICSVFFGSRPIEIRVAVARSCIRISRACRRLVGHCMYVRNGRRSHSTLWDGVNSSRVLDITSKSLVDSAVDWWGDCFARDLATADF